MLTSKVLAADVPLMKVKEIKQHYKVPVSAAAVVVVVVLFL